MVLSRHKKMRVNCICVYVVTLWECMFVSARGLCTRIVSIFCVCLCVYMENVYEYVGQRSNIMLYFIVVHMIVISQKIESLLVFCEV